MKRMKFKPIRHKDHQLMRFEPCRCYCYVCHSFLVHPPVCAVVSHTISAEWKRIGNQIDSAFIPVRTHFVNLCGNRHDN